MDANVVPNVHNAELTYPNSAKSAAALARELTYQRGAAEKINVVATPDCVRSRYRELKLWRLMRLEFMFKALGDLCGKTVLDFACGNGTISTLLAFSGAQVVGMDISPDVIAIARRRAAPSWIE